MESYKRFKDPIYGYLDVPKKYTDQIIDSCVFQRLRRITQTSYSGLYSSSVHNRFVHSMGVYYLGKIASEYLLSCLNADEETKMLGEDINGGWEKVKEVFDLACLLHDVGHAPFSHTGERFFLDNEKSNGKYILIHEELVDLVGSETFKDSIPKSDKDAAAPHEIISAIVGLKEFKDFFPSLFEKEFFARCITGYKYESKNGLNSILNCFITILNSDVIDVDKLDYLIRDAYFSGYQSTSIDYQRLLTSLVVIEKDTESDEEDDYNESDEYETEYVLGYNKNAISIIENVIFAHDAERKWIQTHPIVLYEMYILQHIMDTLDKNIFCNTGKKLFSIEALSPTGIEIENIGKICLLCDDDIIFLLKNLNQDELSKEYFSRGLRRHPLWKSEAEYRAYFTLKLGNSGQIVEKFNEALKETEEYLRKHTLSWVINDEVIEKVRKELLDIKENLKQYSSATTLKKRKTKKDSFKKNEKSKELMLAIMESLQNYAIEKGCKCDFIILSAKSFYSGFNKSNFNEIPIVFNNEHPKLGDVVSTLSSEKTNTENFFYIFYNNNKIIDKEELRDRLVTSMISKLASIRA